jgi:phosphatidylglycerophosphate synthase
MHRKSYYFINAITVYRLVAAPLLLILIYLREVDLFKWLLAVSFFTDAIDGHLARSYKVTSILGAKLDSVADDLTILAGVVGLFVLRWEFVKEEYIWLIVVLGLFVVQTIYAIRRYGKSTSFHTILAKISAVLQGSFLITAFFLPEPIRVLYHITIAVTALDLLEEIVMVYLLPEWQADVKGIYWILRKK